MTTELDREELEHEAEKAICACYFHDLDPEAMTDDDLRAIIADPQWAHKQEQLHNPMPADEYALELENCPSNKEDK